MIVIEHRNPTLTELTHDHEIRRFNSPYRSLESSISNGSNGCPYLNLLTRSIISVQFL
jgi:hypothetical protein